MYIRNIFSETTPLAPAEGMGTRRGHLSKMCFASESDRSSARKELADPDSGRPYGPHLPHPPLGQEGEPSVAPCPILGPFPSLLSPNTSRPFVFGGAPRRRGRGGGRSALHTPCEEAVGGREVPYQAQRLRAARPSPSTPAGRQSPRARPAATGCPWPGAEPLPPPCGTGTPRSPGEAPQRRGRSGKLT